MESHLGQIAGVLYARDGVDVSSLTVLFPSRRARLFFNDALSRVADRPLWQPRYTTMGEMMSQVSGLTVADGVRLSAELYKAYSRYHEESFDSFYGWGQMLLSDFDSIDKYLIDADMLFSNLSDLREMESDLSYLTPEQREVIARFWESFGREEDFSEQKHIFMSIWRTLGPVYHDFRRSLSAQGIAYEGMAYREAARRIADGEWEAPRQRYVVAGFNALSACEKALLDHLAANCEVDFFWDYDRYYMDDPLQEAGLFLRENVRRYPQRVELPGDRADFSREKEITVVSAPSDAVQARYVTRFLTEVGDRQGEPADMRTAVVLTDEQLLVPVLHSIPDQVADINVTMGYPFRLTTAYTFIERLARLRARARVDADGEVRGADASGEGSAFSVREKFYHGDVTGLLRHPYVAIMEPGAAALADKIEQAGRIFVPGEYLAAELPRAGAMFAPAGGGRPTGETQARNGEQTPESAPAPEQSLREWQALASYLSDMASLAAGALLADGETGGDSGDQMRIHEAGYLRLAAENTTKLRNSLEGCGVEVSPSLFASILRKLLQGISIPYEGEPLKGVQVMGILETRSLDFENVVVLSMSDDNFPGNRISSSFIPYSLRHAYGLPTPAHHEGVYAYYFYRLLQRASSVHLVYSSRSDERSSGEQSRYISQLVYESPHRIKRVNLTLDASLSGSDPIAVEKSGETAAELARYLSGEAELSPTALSAYITCPLKFYFHNLAHLAPPEEIGEEVDAPMFGTILHRAAQTLYRPRQGGGDPREYLAALAGEKDAPAIREAAVSAIREKYHDAGPPEKWGGSLLLIRDVITKYLRDFLLPYDASHGAFGIEKTEESVEQPFGFGDGRSVTLRGYADRIDSLPGGALRVVDYKTGAERLEFESLEALFSPEDGRHNPAAFQILLYAMLLSRRHSCDVQPALYFLRSLRKEEYSPLPRSKAPKEEIAGYLQCAAEFEERMRMLLTEIFCHDTPFSQCPDPKPCSYCEFNPICRR